MDAAQVDQNSHHYHQIDVAAPAADKQQQHAVGAGAPVAAPAAAAETCQQKLLRLLAHNMHYFTFLPLILISVLQDINIQLAAALCTGFVLAVILLSWVCHRAGYVKVFPKPFDLFNVSLYGGMLILAFCAHDWLRVYDSLITNLGNACFMWATIVLPCTDNFVMHSVRDRAPAQVADTPLMRRMALLIALTWATALSLMTAGAIIPLATGLPPDRMPVGLMVVTYLLGYGPLLLALPIQLILSHVFRKRIRQKYLPQAQIQQQPEQQPERVPAAVAARDDAV